MYILKSFWLHISFEVSNDLNGFLACLAWRCLQAVNVIVSGTTEDVWAQRGEEVWDSELDVFFFMLCIDTCLNHKGIEDII